MPDNISQDHRGYHLVATIPLAGLIDIIAFLFLPLSTIETEALRRKKALRLSQ